MNRNRETKSSYFEGTAHSKIHFEPFLGGKAPVALMYFFTYSFYKDWLELQSFLQFSL